MSETLSNLYDRIIHGLSIAVGLNTGIECTAEDAANLHAMVTALKADYNDAMNEIDRLNAERGNLVADIVLSQDTEMPMTITDILNRLDGIPPAPESEGVQDE